MSWTEPVDVMGPYSEIQCAVSTLRWKVEWSWYGVPALRIHGMC